MWPPSVFLELLVAYISPCGNLAALK